jgi:putative transposase
MPSTERGIRWRLNLLTKDHPEYVHQCAGKKAFEYHEDCLPEVTRQALRARLARTISLKNADAPAPTVPRPTRGALMNARLEICHAHPYSTLMAARQITDSQRQIADARSSLCILVGQLIAGGMTRKGEITMICDASRCGELSPKMQAAAEMANARKGTTRRGVSVTSLQEWYTTWQHAQGNPAELTALLAPSQRNAQPWQTIPWLNDFFLYYRTWKRPSIRAAYRDWQTALAGQPAALAAMPTCDRVEKTLRRVPVLVRERFRTTGSAWRSLNPFVRREWNTLPVNAVWVGDGHCMKVVCFNPVTGNVFRPEVTFIMDAGQRFIVGWSLALSENTRAIADALRWSMARHGIPLIYYSDNGGGQTNTTLDANITGTGAAGPEHADGYPGPCADGGAVVNGNPQGRSCRA